VVGPWLPLATRTTFRSAPKAYASKLISIFKFFCNRTDPATKTKPIELVAFGYSEQSHANPDPPAGGAATNQTTYH
jgi:hypothetical protein